MTFEFHPQEAEQRRTPSAIDPERYMSKKEIAERDYEEVVDWREKQYDENVKENPKAESMRDNLKVHNGIVLDYALDLIEKQGLSPEEKTEAIIATMMHDGGKLSSDILDHHTKGVEYAGKMLDEMMGQKFNGVEITEEIKQKIKEAIERHMNHPYLVEKNKGERFPEPQGKVDKVVFDADMLANIGFKNVAFRLINEGNFNEDQKKAQENGTTTMEEMFKNVMQGVEQLDKVVLSPEAKEIAGERIGNAREIFEHLKTRLREIQDMFSAEGRFDLSSIKAKGGTELVKKLLNEEIEKAAIELGIDSKIVGKLKM